MADGDGSVSPGSSAFKKKGDRADSLFNNASPVAVVFNYWKEFDLDNARGKLDEQGLKIAEHQESSLKNRRTLASTTKDFKRASDEEKAGMFGPLLKSYQEEVDNMTKRAKFAETAFLNVYQKLYEAPDPVPALATAAETAARVSELETENRKFRQELDEFRTESAHLKNQQATVRRLEERNRQLEQQMEEKVKELVDMRQKVMVEENQKHLEVLKQREGALQEQLRAARESVQTMQRLQEYQQNQLFEYKVQSEEEKFAKQSELNLLMDEVERAQQRLLAIEEEKTGLKAQVTSLVEREPDREAGRLENDLNSNSNSNSLELSLNAKEKMITELHLELQNLETALATERESHIAEMRKLHTEIEAKEVAISKLQSELAIRPTKKVVEDLRKQVKILQAVGYNLVEAEDWEVAAQGQEMGKLESLLLDKNRKMEHDLLQLKAQLAVKSAEVGRLTANTADLNKTVQQQQTLISRLEEDILKGYSSGSKPQQALVDDWEGADAGLGNLVQKRGESADEENSMLTVVCGQRDRFRQRLTEAEDELRATKERYRVLQQDLERYKADNVKLYERIRYVTDYGKSGTTGRGGKKRVEDLEAGSSDRDLAKYKKQYEDDINPFAVFAKKEREQRYKDLGLREKITLTGALFFLGNKYGRMFLFFYSILLHILVFAAMYQLSHVSHARGKYKAIELESATSSVDFLEPTPFTPSLSSPFKSG